MTSIDPEREGGLLNLIGLAELHGHKRSTSGHYELVCEPNNVQIFVGGRSGGRLYSMGILFSMPTYQNNVKEVVHEFGGHKSFEIGVDGFKRNGKKGRDVKYQFTINSSPLLIPGLVRVKIDGNYDPGDVAPLLDKLNVNYRVKNGKLKTSRIMQPHFSKDDIAEAYRLRSGFGFDTHLYGQGKNSSLRIDENAEECSYWLNRRQVDYNGIVRMDNFLFETFDIDLADLPFEPKILKSKD